MTPGPTAERVLDALRAALAGGRFRSGERLDPAILAGELASSVTPVRDALARLSGESLVETRIGAGYFVPHIDEPALKDLYDWNAGILLLVLRALPARAAASAFHQAGEIGVPGDNSCAIETRFLVVARRHPNAEAARAIAGLNARLHAPRRREPVTTETVVAEIEAFDRAIEAADRTTLRRLIIHYHARRKRIAAETVRRLYRQG